MRRVVTGVLLLVVVTLGWLVLAPTQLGGSSSYVTTYGDSMEPGFSAGDLAVVRTANAYGVGDVIAYHSDTLGAVVMHRVVAVRDAEYTLQGDNNSWLDPDHPAGDRVIGRLALRIPRGGIWLDRLTSPVGLALMTVGLLAGGGTGVQRRRGRKRMMPQHLTRDRRTAPTGGLPPWGGSVGAALALAALMGVLLAIPAWTTAPPRSATAGGATGQTMTFSYRTTVRPSAAYDDTVVTSPDPVFRSLADRVDVRYSYTGPPGSIAVRAELSTAGGWHSTVPLRPRVSGDNDGPTGTVRLDLSALEDRAQDAAVVTGIPAPEIRVAIVASVTTSDGTTFEPTLPLVLTPLQLTLAEDAPSLTVTSAATPAPGPGTLNVAGRSVSVSTARTVSVALLLGALLAGLVLGLLALRGSRNSEGASIRRRYAPILIQVHPMPHPAGRPVVDVVDFATLAKLAQRYGLLVMHWSRSNIETFVVQDEGTTYRYRTGTGSAGPTAAVTADTVRRES